MQSHHGGTPGLASYVIKLVTEQVNADTEIQTLQQVDTYKRYKAIPIARK